MWRPRTFPGSRSRMLRSHCSRASGVSRDLVSAGFIPEGKFDPVPESELVIDGPEVVFDDVLCGSDCICNFAVFESLGDEFDDLLFSFAGASFSIALASEHNCLRYKSVASFTRFTPSWMPKRKKRRLKCALTVRRAMFSCLPISSLSHPCNRSSAICCSRGASRTNSSFMRFPPSDPTPTNQSQRPLGRLFL